MTINIRYFTQLFLSYLALLLVAISGLVVFIAIFFNAYLEDRTIQALSRQLTYIDQISLLDSDQVMGVVERIQQQTGYDLRLTMIYPSGDVLNDTLYNLNDMDNHMNRPEVMDANAFGEGSAIRYSHTLHKTMVYAAKKASNNIIYRLSVPLNDIENESRHLVRSLIIYSVLLFLICLTVTYFMSHWISKPLHWMAKTLRQINDHRFDKVRPNPSMIKEISLVNHQLVAMSDSIREYVEHISKHSDRMDMILNNMINGLVVVDESLTIVLINSTVLRLIYGKSNPRSDLNLNDFVDLKAWMVATMAGEEDDPIELDSFESGKQVLVSGSVYSDGGSSKGIFIFQDITRLKRLESTRQNFVANVSHELKTPITFIRSMLETIIASKQRSIQIPDDLLIKTLKHSDRLNSIIDDLLQLSKLETTGEEIQKEWALIRPIVDMVIQQCSPKAQEKNIVIHVEGDMNASVFCTAGLIIQALKNLVDNAVKYSPNNTKILIQFIQKDGWDQLWVTDQGPGIEAHHLEKLFQRFYRVDTARSREMGGTGLGLSIVKHICQAHGGQATVESVVNQGTTVCLEIPRPSSVSIAPQS